MRYLQYILAHKLVSCIMFAVSLVVIMLKMAGSLLGIVAFSAPLL